MKAPIKYLFILLGFTFAGCGSGKNSPEGFIDFENKKVSLNSNYKYSYINVYWEDNFQNKKNIRIPINSNEITFSDLAIVDSSEFRKTLIQLSV